MTKFTPTLNGSRFLHAVFSNDAAFTALIMALASKQKLTFSQLSTDAKARLANLGMETEEDVKEFTEEAAKQLLWFQTFREVISGRPSERTGTILGHLIGGLTPFGPDARAEYQAFHADHAGHDSSFFEQTTIDEFHGKWPFSLADLEAAYGDEAREYRAASALDHTL